MSESGLLCDKLERAYRIAAEIVAKYGDSYLPVFERLHREMIKVTESQSVRNIALNVASGVLDRR
jgi:hypothetical protein